MALRERRTRWRALCTSTLSLFVHSSLFLLCVQSPCAHSAASIVAGDNMRTISITTHLVKLVGDSKDRAKLPCD
jgi:hypothetical protein